MKVKGMVEEWLAKKGFDGLWNQDWECACVVGKVGDVCDDNMSPLCEAGYTLPCDCGEHDYHVGPVKSELVGG